MAEAKKDGFHAVDERTESSAIVKVLDLIRDKNGEVKNMSVKWYVSRGGLVVEGTPQGDEELMVILSPFF